MSAMGKNGQWPLVADFCHQRKFWAQELALNCLLGKRGRAPLRFARHSIAVTIHFCSRAVP